MDSSATMTSEQSSLKRPRSPTEHNPLPAAKVPRTTANPLQINYLARLHKETIPLVTPKDTLPEIARLISEYDGVIQRHESMAGNLGACPLGPILLKRFERLFDGPPKVLKSSSKDNTVTWLDVVEFAQNNPKQFNLERQRNGVRVCQFFTKQCRVEISEEDFVLIASGMPQKLIPPQPIKEDEEKELAVMELLDRNLGQVIQLADQVSGRARQLIHKMKNRRTAILARREQEEELRRRNAMGPEASPMSHETNGINTGRPLRSIEVSQSPPVGFTAVNLRQQAAGDAETRPSRGPGDTGRPQGEELYHTANAGNVTIINGKSVKDASPSVRAEMMKKFLTPDEREAGMTDDTGRRSSMGMGRTNATQASSAENARSGSMDEILGGSSGSKNLSSVAIPNTPASLMPHLKPASADRYDDGGPYKAEMVKRMDSMWKGQRIFPPCDRCRRLHMDCLKNLTACMGCTRKHAKCSWKDVQEHELQATGPPSQSPERDAAVAPGPDPGHAQSSQPSQPSSTKSTIEVAQPSNGAEGPASIARASLHLAGESTEGANGSTQRGQNEAEADKPTAPAPAPAPGDLPSARFDVRPPPLAQQLQDAAEGRAPPGPNSFATPSSPVRRYREQDDDDDGEGDRLQALASRVYRTASQTGHRGA
ncbi:hypothetical protein ABEF95_007343 [Exophiala dermatitidis]|uniref:Zn(2)-C6 fungal-type domain-containing protein n=2 Tax=Exophiala dermatitidis TaxID=5970 RepID=H6C0D5_EXODN|nr:uncharacterized protein HMPREF1120_05276 [Exophiala dermatitidis NIH/UT8656]EHY57230.1 hypothetical protein HMPREF1120_05276 [Exophiala dermatitidis NIH/UT8656]KAJ4542261.1 hypothetical protein HRR78_006961 [Exophiala dermatitidis]